MKRSVIKKPRWFILASFLIFCESFICLFIYVFTYLKFCIDSKIHSWRIHSLLTLVLLPHFDLLFLLPSLHPSSSVSLCSLFYNLSIFSASTHLACTLVYLSQFLTIHLVVCFFAYSCYAIMLGSNVTSTRRMIYSATACQIYPPRSRFITAHVRSQRV